VCLEAHRRIAALGSVVNARTAAPIAAYVDRHGYCLAPEYLRRGVNEGGALQHGVVYDDFLYTQPHEAPYLLDVAKTTPVGYGHECFIDDVPNLIIGRVTVKARCLDIQKDQLVDFLVIENTNRVDGITDVTGILEPYRLDEAMPLEQETGNYPCT
jgi:hypothetical protein